MPRVYRFLFAILLTFAGVGVTYAQEIYEPRFQDPLEDRWRWKKLEEMGSHSQRVVVNDEGMSLILRRGEDNRIFLFDGLRSKSLAHPRTVEARPLRTAFGKNNSILMLADNGLYRYEADAWKKLYDHSLRISPKADVVSAKDGKFWIAGRKGIIEFDENGIIEHRIQQNGVSIVQDLCLGNDDSLWIVVGPSGDVYRCPLVNDQLSPESEWIQVYEGQRDFVLNSFILSSRDDKIWVVNNHENVGALAYDIKSGTWESHNLRRAGGSNYNTSIMESHDGRIWVVGRGSLQIYRDGEWKVYRGPRYPIPDGWPFLSQDSEGFVYLVETGGAVTRIDYGQNQYRSLSGLHFQAEDEQGNYWYLDVNGAVVMENRKTGEWLMHSRETTGVDAPLNLLPLDKGHLLCAGSTSEAAAFSIFDGQNWKLHRYPEFARSFSHLGVIKLDGGDVILSCGQPTSGYPGIEGGMLRLSYLKGNYTVDHHDTIHVPFRPWSIAEDPVNKFIWSGSTQLEIVDFRIPVQTIEFPGDHWIDNLAVTNSGDLWMALWGAGVYQYNEGQWINQSDDSLVEDHHYSYIMTLGGVHPVVATDQGIFRFDGQNWASFTSPGLSMHRVGGTLNQSSDGSLWVNTTHTDWYYRGLKEEPYPEVKKNLFQTVQCVADTQGPTAYFRNSGQTVFSDQEATIRWTGSDYWAKTSRRSLTYSISINDGPWSPFTSKNSISRSDWSGGEHTLRVRARDSDFNISALPAVQTFEIILPIWKRTWAQFTMVLIVLLILGLIVLVVRQRISHLLEMERIKLHFFTNISHELRTPLSLILGPVEKLLIEKKENPDRSSYLRTIQTNTSRLLYLIDQLLDYRRVDQGRLVYEPQQLDLVALVRNVLDSYNFVVKEKHQALSFTTPFQSCKIEMDGDIFYKILDNLIHNAIKYTQPNGSINLSIDLPDGISNPAEADHLTLVVEDNGQGISRELLGNIFEPFYQGSQKAGKMKQGVGIGLALVRELVDVIKGDISVESPVPGKVSGSRFTIEMPVSSMEVVWGDGAVKQEAQPETLGMDAEADEDAQPGTKRTHIHLVEDNLDVLQFLRSELAEDFEVSVSENGLDAEEFVLENLPDLVITDVMMPKQDGFDLCKHLKSNPVSSHIPVIMLTAFKTQHHEEEGLGLGADDYIAKPVSMRVLKLKVANLIAQRDRLRQQIRIEYGLLPSKTEIRVVDKLFLDKAERIAQEFLGDEFFDVEQFAREIGMSRSNFYKKFRDLTGMSPASFMKVKRLTESARRILEKSGNITEIALDVGFSDVSYFSRCFKEHYGCPPSKYVGQVENEPQPGV